MAEYHVRCGALVIYAGTLNSRNKNFWQYKTECTNEATCAVAQYFVQNGKSMTFGYNGELYKLCVIEIDQEEGEKVDN